MATKGSFRKPAAERFDQYQDEGVHRDKPNTVKSSEKAFQGKKGDSIRRRRQDIGKGGEAESRYLRERAKINARIETLAHELARLDAAYDAYAEGVMPSPDRDMVLQNETELVKVKPRALLPADIPTVEDIKELDDIKE